jgi:hypothetical protein
MRAVVMEVLVVLVVVVRLLLLLLVEQGHQGKDMLAVHLLVQDIQEVEVVEQVKLEFQ